jgi:hypothetical protein
MKGVLDPGSTPGRSTNNTLFVPQRPLLISVQCVFDGPEFGFDRAMSKDMDNTVGDDRKSSKIVNANANTKNGTVKVKMSKAAFLGRVAANDSAVALVA